MRVAIVGSREIYGIDIEKYISCGTTEIISGGADGVDTLAREYANKAGIKITEFLPEYEKFGRAAPILRNDRIIENADMICALWDGSSKGTKYIIDRCKKLGKNIKIWLI